MKEIEYHKDFIKHFQKRIKSNKKLVKKFQQRLKLFIKNPQDNRLKNHRLKGKRKTYWSFSVTGDIRVIYKIKDNMTRLYDVGSYNQVYSR